MKTDTSNVLCLHGECPLPSNYVIAVPYSLSKSLVLIFLQALRTEIQFNSKVWYNVHNSGRELLENVHLEDQYDLQDGGFWGSETAWSNAELSKNGLWSCTFRFCSNFLNYWHATGGINPGNLCTVGLQLGWSNIVSTTALRTQYKLP